MDEFNGNFFDANLARELDVKEALNQLECKKDDMINTKVNELCAGLKDLSAIYEGHKFDEGYYLGSSIAEYKLNDCIETSTNLLPEVNTMTDKIDEFKQKEKEIDMSCHEISLNDSLINKCINDKCEHLKKEINDYMRKSSIEDYNTNSLL